jgi:hypothetical protein
MGQTMFESDSASASSHHTCLLYESLDEQRDTILRFLKDGLAAGEQVWCVADEQSDDEWNFELQANGVDVDKARKIGSLVVCQGEHWRRSTPFSSIQNARETWELIENGLAGFSGVRFAVDMAWTLEPPIPHDLVCHWEATLNLVIEEEPRVRTLCLYNTRRHSARRVHSALRTHPYVILGGIYRTNPFYEASHILENEPHFNHSQADGGTVEGMLLQLAGEPGTSSTSVSRSSVPSWQRRTRQSATSRPSSAEGR